MKKNIVQIFSVLLVLTLSCKKENPPSPSTDYSVALPLYGDTLERQYKTLNQGIYNLMKSLYFWNDKVPKIDYNLSKYDSDPDQLLEDLKYQALDKYSFIVDKEYSDQLFEEGTEFGKGFNIAYYNSASIRVSFVYPNSPADNAGLYRGMVIKKINGKEVFSTISDGTIANLLSNSSNALEVIDSTNITKTINITAASYKLSTVVIKKIIEQDGVKIGYLMFNSFLGTSETELNAAFEYFKNNAITELVLDLRYNGGGYVYIANQLAGQIGGDKTTGKTFMNYIYNNDLKEYNSPDAFSAVNNSLNIDRVCILATDNTASASELVINCLKPYMTVKQFGTYTYGKPVGFSGYGYKDKAIYAVEFASTNANNQGGYYNGIAPDQFSIDDLKYPLGDPREAMLSDALYFIKNGTYKSETFREGQAESLKYVKLKGIKSIVGAY